MKIISLFIQNIKRIKAIRLTPKENVNIIAGNNAQGKSSVLDSIMYALGGKSVVPSNVVREGEKGATIQIDIGNITVLKYWNEGKEYLKVYSKDTNAEMKSPQSILDQLYEDLAFDPLEFFRLPNKEQFELICKLTGFSLEDYTKRRALLYTARADINKEAKNLEGKLAGMFEPKPNLPDTPISISDLRARFKEANDIIVHNNGLRSALENYKEDVEIKGKSLMICENEIKRLQNQLSILNNEYADMVANCEQFKSEVEALVDPDFKEIEDEIRKAELINSDILHRNRYSLLQNELGDKKAESNEYTQSLSDLDNQLKETIANLEMPVEGMSITEEGIVLYNNLPLESASQAERIKIGLEIGKTLNPQLRVILCREASLLDSKSMEYIKEWSEKNDYQVFLERVETDDDGAIIIEDGEIVEADIQKT